MKIKLLLVLIVNIQKLILQKKKLKYFVNIKKVLIIIKKNLDEKTLNRVDSLALKCVSYVKNT